MWWSDTMNPTYFPATSYADVGVSNDKMMGFLPYGGTLLLLKYQSIHGQVGTPPNQSIVEIYKGEGLIATDSLKVANGYPTFMSQRGVVQLRQEAIISNSIYKLELISQDVNGIPGIRSGINTETLANKELAFAWVHDNKYFLWLNGTIWVYQYNLNHQEQGETVYPWIPWKTFTNAACFFDKDNYLYFGDTGNLFKFDPTAHSDNGTAIDSFWLSKRFTPVDNTICNIPHIYYNMGISSGIATSDIQLTIYANNNNNSVSSTTTCIYTPALSYVDSPAKQFVNWKTRTIQYMVRENSVSGALDLQKVNIGFVPDRMAR